MTATCDGDHFTCGEVAEWQTGESFSEQLIHQIDTKSSIYLGSTEIILADRKRNFLISRSTETDYQINFLMRDSEGDLFSCSDGPQYTNVNSVSESYRYISTKLAFLDTRYNNAVGIETEESISFELASSEMAGFKEEWGIFYYPKFHLQDVKKIVKTTNFVVLKGQKQILSTATEEILLYEHLILVWPNPPSLAIPWINCEDIEQYGFYDYHATGEGEGQEKIQRDGGDDFYFTDWMRAVGVDLQAADQRDADDRYLGYYLGEGYPPTQSFTNPGILTNSTPCASIAQNAAGKVFYSVTLGGTNFNHLDDGDLLALFPYFSADPKFYPVGLI